MIRFFDWLFYALLSVYSNFVLWFWDQYPKKPKCSCGAAMYDEDWAHSKHCELRLWLEDRCHPYWR